MAAGVKRAALFGFAAIGGAWTALIVYDAAQFYFWVWQGKRLARGLKPR